MFSLLKTILIYRYRCKGSPCFTFIFLLKFPPALPVLTLAFNFSYISVTLLTCYFWAGFHIEFCRMRDACSADITDSNLGHGKISTTWEHTPFHFSFFVYAYVSSRNFSPSLSIRRKRNWEYDVIMKKPQISKLSWFQF